MCIRDRRKVPLQKISEDDIIKTEVDILNEFYKRIYYPPSMQHKNIYIDIETLENWAFKLLLDKKLLDCEKIETIQYFDDISNSSLPLDQLRELGLTDELSEDDKTEIDKLCEKLVEEEKGDEIKEILNTLDCIMCYVCSSTPTPSNETEISTFCTNKFNGKSSFLDFVNRYTEFSKIPIKQLPDLYEVLELKFFDYFSKGWQKIFNEDFDSDAKNNIREP
eukprot:TRINITY_DN29240_c0_g1_i3.p1 TRINITY_DN29240_c0_g1~~TRINITY_DN29240_c0_g1_i3.p1  ORF type:complete len:221 (-),score=43.80 TRINITY_DN29240_c0_g1_i3:13-675(-)